jgi:hypothetical protein
MSEVSKGAAMTVAVLLFAALILAGIWFGLAELGGSIGDRVMKAIALGLGVLASGLAGSGLATMLTLVIAPVKTRAVGLAILRTQLLLWTAACAAGPVLAYTMNGAPGVGRARLILILIGGLAAALSGVLTTHAMLKRAAALTGTY